MDPIGSEVLSKWGVKRSKNNEKGIQLNNKSSRKFIQNDSKLSNDRFW